MIRKRIGFNTEFVIPLNNTLIYGLNKIGEVLPIYSLLFKGLALKLAAKIVWHVKAHGPNWGTVN